MAVLRCKKCGGDLEIIENSSVCECIYCGSKETIPSVDDEKKLKLYDRANRLRMANEFDKAAGVYESIVEEFSEDAEAYWGILLCKYGIEYVDDPATGEKIPTCHRSSYDSMLDDTDFEMVMENADTYSRAVYRDNAKQIDEIRKGIIEVSSKEEPYDIFICYKETDESGNRTVDSVIAQDIYDKLTEKGYRVFFSRITLEDKLGTEYEPYIFAALNSAKVMLAFGTTYDYYNAVWVKNEWSRFLKLMNKDKGKCLIPCYKDIDAYDIPKEFANLQGQDMSKIGAEQDLLRGIQKIIGVKEKTEAKNTQSTVATTTNPTIDSYLKRINMFLEDGEWEKADAYCEKVLDIDPECADAYFGKFMVEYKLDVNNKTLFENYNNNANYIKVLKFGNNELKQKLNDYLNKIDEIILSLIEEMETAYIYTKDSANEEELSSVCLTIPKTQAQLFPKQFPQKV
ncbi:MAG: toll/interleukin-1 receptor domain-containing protein [Firmicutes bacterium]|nr:toll/interleukin-1 receptor domain-containing protein [Bacillota bacterium]